MNAKQKILSLTILTALFWGSITQKAGANYMYGNGEPSLQITVDKEVKPESWSGWHDNLSLDEYAFYADDKVDFKAIVKNTGEDDLNNIKVVDYLPDYVNFVSGPEGASQDGREIKWTIDHLNPGEEKEFTLRVQVVNRDELDGRSGFCVTNRVKATAESGQWDEDTADFCLEEKVLGAQLPEAGANLALGMAAALTAIGAGLLTRKFNR